MANIVIDKDKITINGETIEKRRTFKDGYWKGPNEIVASNYKYKACGIHGCNPGCYTYLDSVIVIDKDTGKYEGVFLNRFAKKHNAADGRLLDIVAEDGTNNFIVTIGEKAQIKKRIRTNVLFGTPVEMGDRVKPGGYYHTEDILYKLFEYEASENGVIMKLCENVSKERLLLFDGFTMAYDLFKIWKEDGQGYFLMANRKTGAETIYSFGGSTTCCSDYIWTQKNKLMDCIGKVFPTHPLVKDSLIVEDYK